MIWYKDLYVGESIVHKTKKVKWKIMHNAGQIGIYVITLASNTQNLLDIIPSYELMQKGYPKKDMVVVGLAKGYDEAIEVAASIVDEVYYSTGTFAVRAYLAEKQKKKTKKNKKKTQKKKKQLDPADAACTFSADCFSCISCAGSLQDGWKHRRKYPGSGESALAASYSVVWLFL